MAPFFPGGGTENYLRAAGNAGGDGQHKHGGKEGSAAAGNVKPHPADGNGPLDAGNAGSRFHADFPGLLRLVESLDILHGLADGLLHLRGYLGIGLTDKNLGHFDGFQRPAFDFQGELAEGFVALLFYSGQDNFHAFCHHGIIGRWTPAKGIPAALGRVVEDFH